MGGVYINTAEPNQSAGHGSRRSSPRSAEKIEELVTPIQIELL
jgi:hypothetical protein